MPDLTPILKRVPAWSQAQTISIEQIAGLTNTNYHLTVDGEGYVLRVSGANTSRLGINRLHERAALEAAAGAGLGPEVVAFLLPEGHLVTRWVDGRHWDVVEYRTPENVHLLTDTTRRIHALRPNGAIFSPFGRVEAYLEVARGSGEWLPPDLDGFLQIMQAVRADQQGDTSDWQRLCHNDLVSVNYLFQEQERKIVVLDWEFAGLGDIYYDLATVVYTHDSDGPIPLELEEIMLQAYFGQADAFQRRRLLGMKYMLMLFTGMWGLVQHSLVAAGKIPAVEGFDYLEFAQYLFAHDLLELRETFEGQAKRSKPRQETPA